MNRKKTIALVFAAVFFVISPGLFGQKTLLEKNIKLHDTEYNLQLLLNELITEHSVSLSYTNKDIPAEMVVHIDRKEQSLRSLLDQIEQQAGLEYYEHNETIILKTKIPSKKYVVSGIIKDTKSGETLPYASIMIAGRQLGTVSNKFGFYSITLPEGTYTLVFNYMGYAAFEKIIDLKDNMTVHVEMSPKSEDLEEVVIVSRQTDAMADENRLSSIDIQKIKEIPASFGEADVLRSCQSLPGVVSIVEAGGGYFVRGGAWDQNLMLLDEAVVYNNAHIEGFFSVFNPEVLKDVKFFKGGIPAKYGGRISSVMDITQKEGNMKSYHINAGIGLIASKLMIEGPVIRDKASFVLAARRSYLDIFFKYLPNEDIKDSRYFFYDLNARFNFILTPKNRLYLSVYSGSDHLENSSYEQEYGNLTTTFRWNHIFGNRLFSNTSIIYSDYVMQDMDNGNEWSWKKTVGIDHYELKENFTWYLSGQMIEFGANMQYVTFHPGNQVPLTDSSFSSKIKIPDQYSVESALYVEDNIKFTPNLDILIGLRLSDFRNLGPANVFIYDPDFPKDEYGIVDTIHYKNNRVIKKYSYLEPRFSAKYDLNDNHALRFTYNRTVQYIHRITQNYIALPIDMYKPSDPYLKPVLCDQVALGYFTSFSNKKFELSAEVYSKRIHNIIEVKPASDIYLNPTLNADLLQGNGKAYGIETMVSKTKGLLTGSLSYTFSRSLKRIAGESKYETLNFGDYYPAHYDIPHQVKLILQYKKGSKWSFHADFLYLTGRPVSFPDGQYVYAETLIPYYSGINQNRLPDYHRLNLGATRYSLNKPGRKWRGYWNFSVYNCYARKNAHSIYIRRKPSSRNTEAVRLSIIGTIVPSFSYTMEF